MSIGRYFIPDAAQRHGVSEDFLRRRIRDGKLPATRDERGRYLIVDADVARIVAGQRRGITVDAAVEQIVAAAPALSDAQRDRLATALQGVAA